MAITLNTKTYSSYRQQADQNLFAGPANSLSVKDTVTLRRVFPKVTKDSAGVARPGIKVVKTLTLADGTKKDMIIDVSSSIPSGAAEADVLLVLDDVADLLALQDAKDLFTDLEINA